MNKIGFLIYHDNNRENCSKLIELFSTVSNSYTIVTNDRNSDKFSCDTRIYRAEKKYFAACVNDGLRELSKNNCEHIFIVRDNVELSDIKFVGEYIKCFESTGIHILFNTNAERVVLDYKDCSVKVADRFLKHFLYINIKCIKEIGYLDEKYQDSFEVLDYYYRLYNKGLSTPVSYFTSPNIDKFNEINLSVGDSFDEDIMLRGLKLFKIKYNYTPVDLPLLNMTEASQVYQKLFTRFAKNNKV